MASHVLHRTVSALAAVMAAASAVAAGTAVPAPEALLSRCLEVEQAALLPSLGIDPRLPDRSAVASMANGLCEHAVRSCGEAPDADACQLALSKYGMGSGVPVSTRGKALFNAAYAGQTPTVEAALRDGAEVNWTNVAGWTPVMIAAAERHREVVALLLQAGADPNRRNHFGRTALMFASAYGDLDIVRQLLAAGAQVDTVPTDSTGLTALMAAASRGHSEVVRALLDAGARPSLTARNGQTAADMARAAGHARVLELLEH